MRVVSLFLQKPGQKDDILHFDRFSEDPDRIRVTYYDGSDDRDYRYVFYMPTSAIGNYIGDMMFGLRHDIDPFECIQVTTAITPTILYHVKDLDDEDVRANIRTTIQAASSLHVTSSRGLWVG